MMWDAPLLRTRPQDSKGAGRSGISATVRSSNSGIADLLVDNELDVLASLLQAQCEVDTREASSDADNLELSPLEMPPETPRSARCRYFCRRLASYMLIGLVDDSVGHIMAGCTVAIRLVVVVAIRARRETIGKADHLSS